MIIQVFQIPWFFHAWNFFLVIFQVFDDFRSLWEPWNDLLSTTFTPTSVLLFSDWFWRLSTWTCPGVAVPPLPLSVDSRLVISVLALDALVCLLDELCTLNLNGESLLDRVDSDWIPYVNPSLGICPFEIACTCICLLLRSLFCLLFSVYTLPLPFCMGDGDSADCPDKRFFMLVIACIFIAFSWGLSEKLTKSYI